VSLTIMDSGAKQKNILLNTIKLSRNYTITWVLTVIPTHRQGADLFSYSSSHASGSQ